MGRPPQDFCRTCLSTLRSPGNKECLDKSWDRWAVTVRIKSSQLCLLAAVAAPLQHTCGRNVMTPVPIFPHLSLTRTPLLPPLFSRLYLPLIRPLALTCNFYSYKYVVVCRSFILLLQWLVSLLLSITPDGSAHWRNRRPCVGVCGKAWISLTTLVAPEMRPQAGCCVRIL